MASLGRHRSASAPGRYERVASLADAGAAANRARLRSGSARRLDVCAPRAAAGARRPELAQFAHATHAAWRRPGHRARLLPWSGCVAVERRLTVTPRDRLAGGRPPGGERLIRR